MLATSWTGRRTVIRLGLLGTALLLLLTATIALSAESRSAAADRRGYGAESWVTSWSASPQRAIAGPLATRGLDHRTVRDIIDAAGHKEHHQQVGLQILQGKNRPHEQ